MTSGIYTDAGAKGESMSIEIAMERCRQEARVLDIEITDSGDTGDAHAPQHARRRGSLLVLTRLHRALSTEHRRRGKWPFATYDA